MTKVSKNEFFKRIFDGKLDVHPTIINDRYPYTTDWRFHRQFDRKLFGKSVDRTEGGLVATDYFLAA